MTASDSPAPHLRAGAAVHVITIFGAGRSDDGISFLPAIYNLTRDGLLHENTVVVGFARTPEDRRAVPPGDAGGGAEIFAHQAGGSGHLGKSGGQAVFTIRPILTILPVIRSLAKQPEELDEKFRRLRRPPSVLPLDQPQQNFALHP